MNDVPTIVETVHAIRQHNPLILNITNFVAMDFSANALLAVGASPIMSLEPNELRELVDAAKCIVINMGTLNEKWVQCATYACKIANCLHKPIVYDPVGVGATSQRTKTGKNLLTKFKPEIVRGNASEILALLTGQHTTKGVDATLSSESVIELAKEYACQHKTTFVISGAVDYVVSSKKVIWIKNGDKRMTFVTAMGCVSTCIIAAFKSVEPDSQMAAVGAMTLVGICGEKAASKSDGPGSLRSTFLDLLASDHNSLIGLIKVGFL